MEFQILFYFLTLFAAQQALVLALVQLSKKFVPAGNWRVVAALLIGAVIGAGCLSLGYAKLQPLPPYQQIPLIIFFILIAGLSAAGFYDLKNGA